MSKLKIKQVLIEKKRNWNFLLIVQETKMYCRPPETYVAEMTTPREFNLTTTLEEIHNKTCKMQRVTGQERKFEQMLYKYHQAPRE